MECYFDNSATTRCPLEVVELMNKVYMEDYGNPSSKHMYGVTAEKYIKQTKQSIAKTLKCEEKEILFTSGGTESNNMAIICGAFTNMRAGKHILVSSVEHSSVKEPMSFLESQGFEVEYIPVDSQGFVSPKQVASMLRDDTIMVSMMYVNNEIGTIQPVEEVGNVVKAFNPNILYHVDAIQAYGKMKIVPKRLKIDLLSVSGHKIHGPKGIGFLYIKDKTKIKPLIYGGGQQKGMRSGTENVPGIAGLGAAVDMVYNNSDTKMTSMYGLRDYFIEQIKTLEGVQVNGPVDNEEKHVCAPHIVSVSFTGVRSEVLLHALEDKGIYVSSGSACSSNKPALSNTLVAINLDRNLLDSTIRFSFCEDNTKDQVDYAIKTLADLLPMLRKYVRG